MNAQPAAQPPLELRPAAVPRRRLATLLVLPMGLALLAASAGADAGTSALLFLAVATTLLGADWIVAASAPSVTRLVIARDRFAIEGRRIRRLRIERTMLEPLVLIPASRTMPARVVLTWIGPPDRPVAGVADYRRRRRRLRMADLALVAPDGRSRLLSDWLLDALAEGYGEGVYPDEATREACVPLLTERLGTGLFAARR